MDHQALNPLQFLGVHLKRCCDEVLTHTVSQPEKITDGTFDAWRGAVVPVHPYNNPPTVVLLGDAERHPDMLDASRSIYFA